MHFGKKNPKNQYQLNDKTLEETVLEKDLGVYVTPNMKSESHVAKIGRALDAAEVGGGANFIFSD